MTLERVFHNRAEQSPAELPVFSRLCRAVADDPALAAPLAGLPVRWNLPDRLLTAVSLLLRAEATGHPLAAHFATLGGGKGADGTLVDTFAAFLAEHHERLTALVRDNDSRWNDPARVAQFWPAFALTAARDTRPLWLVELGGAAGLTARPDRYGYRFTRENRTETVNGDRPLVLDLELRGEDPAHLGHPVRVAGRCVIDRDPIRTDDPATVALLRASVRPDLADQLRRVDLALAETANTELTWHIGDLLDVLPAALAEIPDGRLPVVYGSSVLCCLHERRPRFAEILAEAGRDLVWLSIEAPANSLGLISRDPVTETNNKAHLTAVTYRDGRVVSAETLALADSWGRWLYWDPRPVEITS
ncbi:hypothetical protein Pen01_26950 [Phytomonospora endophytica]|nr:hypothetical protein Pen01_26950 [Phytomonospora endophytica]